MNDDASTIQQFLTHRVLTVTRQQDGTLVGHYRGRNAANLSVAALMLALTSLSVIFAAGLIGFLVNVGATVAAVVGLAACAVCGCVAGKFLVLSLLDIPTRIELCTDAEGRGSLVVRTVRCRSEFVVSAQQLETSNGEIALKMQLQTADANQPYEPLLARGRLVLLTT